MQNNIVELGPMIVNIDTRRVFIKDKLITLRNKEFSLLTYFISKVGKVISRTQILEDVWDRNICCPTNTVDVHVSSLRKKIGKYLSYEIIKTVHCIGYILEI